MHGHHSPIEPTHNMVYHIGDVVEFIDKDEPALFPNGPVRGTIKRFHKSKSWYWVQHASAFYSVPVRWDMIKLIKR